MRANPARTPELQGVHAQLAVRRATRSQTKASVAPRCKVVDPTLDRLPKRRDDLSSGA